ncbi:MAG TPA: ArsA family ATPase [Nitrospiria bacterium]|nr:ArsA family ATPase [Nitrospiria bacterium]
MNTKTDPKFIFFGGKGGVGKTTCASAFALGLSRQGKRTLLVSTDLAHSLSDLFEKPIGGKTVELEPALFGLEIDPDREAQTYLERIRSGFSHRLEPEAARNFSRQLDLAAASPGTQEAALFDRVTDILLESADEFDRIVFDTAPTGQTLRLLLLPELMGPWIDSLTSQRTRVSSFFQMFSRVSGKPVSEDPILGLLKKRKEKFARCREIMTDPSQTGFYFVLIPEKLPILETQKALPRLEKYGVPIRALIINRILPSGADGSFLKDRLEQEKIYLDDVKERLGKWSLVQLQQRGRDVMGRKELEAFSKIILKSLLPENSAS